MPGEAREILRLHRCPECDYDLTGLPAAHRCPECGFEYDETMFDVPGWWEPGSRRRSVSLWSGIVLVLIVIAMAAIVVRTSFSVPRWMAYVAIALAVVTASRFRWYRIHTGVPEIQILSLQDGLVVRRLSAKQRTRFRWSVFRAARIRKIRMSGGSRWNLILKRRWPVAGFRWPIGVLIECDRRTAAVVRNEIRRRIRAANETG